MDDDVAEIEEDPAAITEALRGTARQAVGLQLLAEGFSQSVRMNLGRGVADHEVIGDQRKLAQIEDNRALRLLVGQRCGGEQRLLASAARPDSRGPCFSR